MKRCCAGWPHQTLFRQSKGHRGRASSLIRRSVLASIWRRGQWKSRSAFSPASPARPRTRCGKSMSPTGTAIPMPTRSSVASRRPTCSKARNATRAKTTLMKNGWPMSCCTPPIWNLWAQQGHAPLTMALADLAVIAVAFLEPLAGGTPQEAASHYADSGWEIDASARSVMALAQQTELEKPIYAVLEALSRRWLEKQAGGFKALVKKHGYPEWTLPEVADGTVVLFVDGLRFDLARELEAALHKDNGLDVALKPGFTS